MNQTIQALSEQKLCELSLESRTTGKNFAINLMIMTVRPVHILLSSFNKLFSCNNPFFS